MGAGCQIETVAAPAKLLEDTHRALTQLLDVLGSEYFGTRAPSTSLTPPDQKHGMTAFAREFSQRGEQLPTVDWVKLLIRQQRARETFFEGRLISDPVWSILLDLMLARLEDRHISITSACLASGAPSTTALRYLGQLEERGMVRRYPDPFDQRRTFIVLTDKTFETFARLLVKLKS